MNDYLIAKNAKPTETFSKLEKVKKDLELYLDQLPTIDAEIIQINADQSSQKGRVCIDRKNKRLRLDYPSINQVIVVKDDVLYMQEDEKSDVQQIDASYTPAGLLLQKRIRFGKDVYVQNLDVLDGTALLTLTDNESGDHGSMTLSFSIDPFIKLTGWIVVDLQGNATQVIVENLKGGIELKENLFKKPGKK